MIIRIWHGWTTFENADAYENLLKTEVLTGIAGRKIHGYIGSHLLRRELEREVEFVTILWFESLEAIKDFAGEDHETAVVPPAARKLLSRFDATSQHYDLLTDPHLNP